MKLSLKDSAIILLITSIITLFGNFAGYNVSILEALPGMVILLLVSVLGIMLSNVMPGNIPSVAYIVTLSTILTIPGVPFAEEIFLYTSKVNFLALTTPILGYAGIYTGKNLDDLKKTGWRIVVLTLAIIFGTYFFSALIAQIILKFIGMI